MDRLAAETVLEKAKEAAATAQAAAEATAHAAARPPQKDGENEAWQFDDSELQARVETLQATIRDMESDLVTRGILPEDFVLTRGLQHEVAEDHPVTSYQAKLALAATLEQTIKDHREIVEREILANGAFLDDEKEQRMVELSNQAASMQEIANKAQDFFFYFPKHMASVSYASYVSYVN